MSSPSMSSHVPAPQFDVCIIGYGPVGAALANLFGMSGLRVAVLEREASAYHLPRAIGAFRKVGFMVEAYPVDWRTRGSEDLARVFSTLSEGLSRTDTAVHEWLGLVVYWLTGRSSELFPGP